MPGGEDGIEIGVIIILEGLSIIVENSLKKEVKGVIIILI
jgi:hypothetical protein